MFGRVASIATRSVAPTTTHGAVTTTTARRGIADVYIGSTARTPIGSFRSSLADVPATKLGAIAVQGAIERAGGLEAADVEDGYMGNVISAGLGQAPARQAMVGAGCPFETEATTVNKVCASGMKAITLAAQNIQLGQRDVMVAGGMESMSQVPYINRNLRGGSGYGDQVSEDLILGDGLTDVYDDIHMGVCAEHTAEKYDISREAQDEFALESYRRSAEAWTSGKLSKEVVPVVIETRRGTTVVDTDEEFPKVKPEKVPKLRAVFKKDGTVNAANSSTLNDGAAAITLFSKAGLDKHPGVKPLARILGFADAALAPIDFPVAPAEATKKALAMAGKSVKDIDVWEINEAFAVVVLANMKILGIDADKVNVNGGAVSLGHPIGASGARIVATLAEQLEPGQLGCASICNGGGGSTAIVLEKM
eukprot:UC1_evm1s176